MNTTTITCPNCGLSKPVPNEKLPRKTATVSCPSCKTTFKLKVQRSESNNRPLNKTTEAKTENRNPAFKKPIPKAPLAGVFIRFACYYIGLSIFFSIILKVLGLSSNSGATAGVLIGATTLSCHQFKKKNGRSCRKEEKKKIVIGIALTNLAIQTALSLLLFSIIPQSIHFSVLVLSLVIIGVLHPIVIYFTVRSFFKKPKEDLGKNKKSKGSRVKCHACDKDTFEGDAHEHLGRKICVDCWEMKLKY